MKVSHAIDLDANATTTNTNYLRRRTNNIEFLELPARPRAKLPTDNTNIKKKNIENPIKKEDIESNNFKLLESSKPIELLEIPIVSAIKNIASEIIKEEDKKSIENKEVKIPELIEPITSANTATTTKISLPPSSSSSSSSLSSATAPVDIETAIDKIKNDLQNVIRLQSTILSDTEIIHRPTASSTKSTRNNNINNRKEDKLY